MPEEIAEVRGTRNPFKKIYTGLKTKDFLRAVKNVNFEEYKFPRRQNNTFINCKEYFVKGNIRKTAEELIRILNAELSKEKNQKKLRQNKDASCKYLLAIKNACEDFVKEVKNYKKSSDYSNTLNKFKEMHRAFKAASTFSDPHKISFLSDKNVRTYMKNQTKTLKEAIDKIEAGLREDQRMHDR